VRLGLIASTRAPGDRRLYERSVLRRLAVIRAGQRAAVVAHFEVVGALAGAPDP